MADLIFDIETGPLSEDRLRAIYRDPTFEEFSETCDQRWKPETRQAKYEEAKASGWKSFVDRAALSAITGQVLAIGLQRSHDGATVILAVFDGVEESEILEHWWTIAGKYRRENGRMIGFNSNGFDLPFLVRRSMFHKVTIPDWVFDFRGFFHQQFVDLRRVWGCGDMRTPGTLDDLGRFFGIGGKPEGVCGGDFARLWFGTAEERKQAVAYLENDLELTKQLAIRMGVVKQ